MNSRYVLAAALSAMIPMTVGAASPQVLTAVCRSPSGTTLVAGQQRDVSEPDGFGDGLFTYTWKIGEPSATIVSQSGRAAGSVPSTETAAALTSDGFVTFLVKYDRAMWMHTLFLDRKTIIISRHVSSLVNGSPVGGLYKATCSIAVQ